MYIDPQTRMTQEQIEQQAREYAKDDLAMWGYLLPNTADAYTALERTHAIFRTAYMSVVG